MRREAHVVVDLGFGDSGKGTLVDHLVRRTGARLVVRFNGGAQAGHTVVLPDGRFHTFSQVGAGAFLPEVETYLSRFTLVHPGGLIREAYRLEQLGVERVLERVTVDPDALLITPFHQAANRLREILRCEGRHGSCGLGIGETASDALEFPDEAIRLGGLRDSNRVRMSLVRCQQRKWELFSSHRHALMEHPLGATEMGVLENAEIGERWLALVERLCTKIRVARPTLPAKVIFEGAQGVLLDEWRGFHPHTTWSTCTYDNVLTLLDEWEGKVTRWGVIRSYSTRHGTGPFPTEDAELDGLIEPHNTKGPWQGGFRRGHLDLCLAAYAVECCQGVDALALTLLDLVSMGWKFSHCYAGLSEEYYRGGRIKLGNFQDLTYQERLGRVLSRARPVYGEVGPTDLVTRVEEKLELPVRLESWGPCYTDKRER